MYFPADYPQSPPLLYFETGARSMRRFNPNLYAVAARAPGCVPRCVTRTDACTLWVRHRYTDGKVCLSLLNTASSGGEAVKWNPEHSNLKQVLLSIQSMIFVSDPMYNMPGLNRAKGTKVCGGACDRQHGWATSHVCAEAGCLTPCGGLVVCRRATF